MHKTLIRYFPTPKQAWDFMKACDEAGIGAGYPRMVREGFSVQYIPKEDK